MSDLNELRKATKLGIARAALRNTVAVLRAAVLSPGPEVDAVVQALKMAAERLNMVEEIGEIAPMSPSNDFGPLGLEKGQLARDLYYTIWERVGGQWVITRSYKGSYILDVLWDDIEPLRETTRPMGVFPKDVNPNEVKPKPKPEPTEPPPEALERVWVAAEQGKVTTYFVQSLPGTKLKWQADKRYLPQEVTDRILELPAKKDDSQGRTRMVRKGTISISRAALEELYKLGKVKPPETVPPGTVIALVPTEIPSGSVSPTEARIAERAQEWARDYLQKNGLTRTAAEDLAKMAGRKRTEAVKPDDTTFWTWVHRYAKRVLKAAGPRVTPPSPYPPPADPAKTNPAPIYDTSIRDPNDLPPAQPQPPPNTQIDRQVYDSLAESPAHEEFIQSWKQRPGAGLAGILQELAEGQFGATGSKYSDDRYYTDQLTTPQKHDLHRYLRKLYETTQSLFPWPGVWTDGQGFVTLYRGFASTTDYRVGTTLNTARIERALASYTSSRDQAESFAKQAAKAFGGKPYVLSRTVPKEDILAIEGVFANPDMPPEAQIGGFGKEDEFIVINRADSKATIVSMSEPPEAEPTENGRLIEVEATGGTVDNLFTSVGSFPSGAYPSQHPKWLPFLQLIRSKGAEVFPPNGRRVMVRVDEETVQMLKDAAKSYADFTRSLNRRRR